MTDEPKKYRIDYEKERCIGAGACVAACPTRWEMKEDGKAHLIGSEVSADGNFEKLEIGESEFEGNMEAAKVCPVLVIHLIKKENNEKLI